ncbi:MAG TPA: DUF5916 domain-containing protein [Bdellovibrionota bacterium]|nr:DUF5916 domain-containing protein [Bdellovibrionota bacterium]
MANAVRSGETIQIDGKLDENSWKEAPVYTGFTQMLPFLGQPATERTEFRVLYDDVNLYFGIILFDREPDKIVKRAMSHDSVRTFDDDFVTVNIDPQHDHRTGYSFTANPRGAQVDGKGINNGNLFITEWDTVWSAGAQIREDGWVAEFKIPFTSLDYDAAGNKEFGLNVTRQIARKSELSVWAPLYRPFPPRGTDLETADFGHLAGVEFSPKPWRHLSLLPYFSSGFRENLTDTDSVIPAHTRDVVLKPGIDLKYPIERTAISQLTVNTDFSQVDVDNQQINLSRFDLFFPEKRPFFLEGSQFFEFGVPQSAQLFFSRKIGLQDGREVPILAGGRSYGKINRSEYGFLNIQTEDTSQVPDRNFTVARFKQDIFARSEMGFMAIHQQDTTGPLGSNTSGGIDATFRSVNGRLVVNNWAAATNSDPNMPDEITGNGTSAYNGTVWRPGLWEVRQSNLYVSDEFNPEAGFFTRAGIFEPAASLYRSFLFPEYGFSETKVGVQGNFFTSDEMDQFLDYTSQGDITLTSNSGYTYHIVGKHFSDRALNPFVLNSKVTIPAGRYTESNVGFGYFTPSRYAISGSVEYSYGGFYGGTIHTWIPTFTAKPIDGLYLKTDASISRIEIPSLNADYFSSALNFSGSYSFLFKMSIDANVGWNQDNSLLVFQYRYRWHFASLSDLFVVYNEERASSNLNTSFRGLIFKIVGYFSI